MDESFYIRLSSMDTELNIDSGICFDCTQFRSCSTRPGTGNCGGFCDWIVVFPVGGPTTPDYSIRQYGFNDAGKKAAWMYAKIV